MTLRVRVPDSLVDANGGQKYLLVQNVWFEHGQLELYAALDAGQAISYRFLRDAKGWRVFASTNRLDLRQIPDTLLGAVGVDINADHLAVAETDRFGNLVKSFRIPCVTHSRTSGQRQHIIRVAAKKLVQFAAESGKPLVHEALDFTRKKQELRSSANPRYARMLSSFAYNATIQALASNALLSGVSTVEVNPAYTSVMGRVKYAKRLGITIHQAAALVIARRGMRYGEVAPARSEIPDGKSDHFVMQLPVRNRGVHEWSHWAKIRSQLLETLAGWHRLRSAALEDTAKAAASRGPTDVRAVRSRTSNSPAQPFRSASLQMALPCG